MTDLESSILNYANLYYTDGSSPISDEEFDKLVEELRNTNPNSSLLKTGYGYKVDNKLHKFNHLYGEIGSLKKFRTFNEMKISLKNTVVDVSLKLDGLSVVLYYKDDKFIRGVTRGDGHVGLDITHKLQELVPQDLNSSYNFTGAIRGEILMTFENFEEFKRKNPDCKNPRNSAAGIVNRIDSFEDMNYLTVVVYNVVGCENIAFNNILDMRLFLKLCFGESNVVPYNRIKLCTESELVQTMESLKSSWYSLYPADGLVLTSINMVYSDSGEVIYDSQAFKFQSPTKESLVKRVEWSMSKTRYAVPRIIIEPIELSGSTITACTGYNAKYIKDNNIGPGSIVLVEKRGEIIPNVTKVIESSSPQLITKCPSCKSRLVWNGVHLQCPNNQCESFCEQNIDIWIDNIAPVHGLKSKIRMKYLKQDFGSRPSIEQIMNYKDKYRYTDVSKEFTGHRKLMKDMYDKLYGSSKISIVSALKALNIPRLGDQTCEKFSTFPEAILHIIDHVEDISVDWTFASLESMIGYANAESVCNNINRFLLLRYIKDRIDFNLPKHENYKFVAVTGKLNVKRSEFEKLLESNGFKLSGISSKTICLITNDPNSTSSKNMQASRLGVPKLTEDEFYAKYISK